MSLLQTRIDAMGSILFKRNRAPTGAAIAMEDQSLVSIPHKIYPLPNHIVLIRLMYVRLFCLKVSGVYVCTYVD